MNDSIASLLADGKYQHAKQQLQQQLLITPHDPDVLYQLAICCLYQQNPDDAQAILTKLSQQFPKQSLYVSALADSYRLTGDRHMATRLFKHAITLNKYDWQAYNGYASLLIEQDPETALLHLHTALNCSPDNRVLLVNIAKCYSILGDYSLSSKYIKQTLKTYPENWTAITEWLNNLYELGQYQEIISQYQQNWQSISNLPREIYFYLASSYYAKTNLELAIKFFKLSVSEPYDSLFRAGNLAACHADACAWQDQQKISIQIKPLLNNANLEPLHPMHGQFLFADSITQRLINNNWDSRFTAIEPLGIKQHHNKKLHLGFISPDFCLSPVSLLTEGWFKYFDRNKVTIYGFANKAFPADPFYQRYIKQFDYFFDLSGLPYKQAAQTIASQKIDILIDLAGHTKHHCLNILAYQPCAIQAHLLGYTGPLACKVLPYWFTTKYIYPPEIVSESSDIPVYLPQLDFATHPWPEHLPKAYRKDYHLPAKAMVFCYFGATYRINQEVFTAWLTILANVPDSVLWLGVAEPLAISNLYAYAAQFNIAKHRIIFCRDTTLTVHWQQQLADLWLDTFVFSSGTTCYLNLWAGLPVLSMAGNTPQSRISANLLINADLRELVTTQPQEYINIAISLAKDRTKLKQYRRKLLCQRDNLLHFKQQEFTQQFTLACHKLYQHHWSYQQPVKQYIEE